jgi:hypothetical protein
VRNGLEIQREPDIFVSWELILVVSFGVDVDVELDLIAATPTTASTTFLLELIEWNMMVALY